MSTIITHRQFPNYHKYEMELAGRPLTLEVGKLAELANAAVMVGYGDTRVLVCATASARPRDGIDFFPLSVDFEEKLYSVGRIPGSFNRREGRPGEKGILTSRVIDRPIRPLFPYDFRNDVSIMATVMAVDHDCSPEIAALIGKGGSVIQKIVADTGAKIDIDDDGTIHIASADAAACDAAKKCIDDIVFVPEVGKLYYGRVVRLMQFGAFVEIAPGKDGLVHISKLDKKRVEKVEDVVTVGDMIWVKFMEIDEKGRWNLSRKDALLEIEAQQAEAAKEQ